jgi:hypothetical protein
MRGRSPGCRFAHVMSVRYVVDTGDHGAAPFGQGRLLGELVVVAVQVVVVLRDDLAVASENAIRRGDGRSRIRT